MPDERLVAGVDLGGTKVLTLITDSSMKEVGRDQRTSDASGGPDVTIGQMADSVRAAANGREIAIVGISTAGPVDLRRGLVTEPPNLHGWHNVPIAERLQDLLKIECVMQHDANCGAISELRLGAGKGTRHMVYITLGTGVGGGLVLNGEIYDGLTGSAGEIGHMIVEPGGRVCNCGRTGCLEAMVGGHYLGLDAQDLVKAEPQGILAGLAAKAGTPADAKLLSEAADAGDKSADAVIHRAGEYLGAGLVNLINVFNPELIVMGGALLHLGERYFGPARAVAERDSFKGPLHDVRMVAAQLGEEAPAMGAALVAWDSLSRRGA